MTSTREVDRFDIGWSPAGLGPGIVPKANGTYVRHSDYIALLADYERLRGMEERVKEWWREHQYDAVSVPDGDGYREEYNLYDEPPEFVKLALFPCLVGRGSR